MTSATTSPTITLNDGAVMPQLGFGVFRVPDDETQRAVETALEAGYRAIDTAAIYENERGVGAALAATGIARDELFITTKVWNTEQGFDSTRAAFETSHEKLGLEIVDLYLIHWPTSDQAQRHETWRALEQLKSEGAVRSIGVSNFNIEHLEPLLEQFETVPSINQVELHPRFQQGELRAFHGGHGIATEGW
ncbi:MAG: aldo/keto reductase, partial [Thermoleophilia bacterium]|nr:aldo/keto reductase [Thermoleophilia bacterium]